MIKLCNELLFSTDVVIGQIWLKSGTCRFDDAAVSIPILISHRWRFNSTVGIVKSDSCQSQVLATMAMYPNDIHQCKHQNLCFHFYI